MDARPTLSSVRPGRAISRFVRTRGRTTGFRRRCDRSAAAVVVRPAMIRAHDRDRHDGDDDRQREQNARGDRVRSYPTAAAAAVVASRRRPAAGATRDAPSPTLVVVQLSADDVVVSFGTRHCDCSRLTLEQIVPASRFPFCLRPCDRLIAVDDII